LKGLQAHQTSLQQSHLCSIKVSSHFHFGCIRLALVKLSTATFKRATTMDGEFITMETSEWR
jgi:hypothetical protein